MRACGTASGSVIRVCADSGLWPCHMPMARVTCLWPVSQTPACTLWDIPRGIMRYDRGLTLHKRGLLRHKSGLVRCKKRPGGVQKEA